MPFTACLLLALFSISPGEVIPPPVSTKLAQTPVGAWVNYFLHKLLLLYEQHDSYIFSFMGLGISFIVYLACFG